MNLAISYFKGNRDQAVRLQERLANRYLQEPFSGCWIWEGSRDSKGKYGQIRINDKLFAAHRISYLAYVGDIPDGKMVLHRCDTPSCVNPNHLFIGSAVDNVRDMIKKGRTPRRDGEYSGRAKISESQVREIRYEDSIRGHESQRNLARRLSPKYGLVPQSVRSIIQGFNWKAVI